MPPKLNRRRALFVLSKIDAILAWERDTENQRDGKFVELGRYLCEVRREGGEPCCKGQSRRPHLRPTFRPPSPARGSAG